MLGQGFMAGQGHLANGTWSWSGQIRQIAVYSFRTRWAKIVENSGKKSWFANCELMTYVPHLEEEQKTGQSCFLLGNILQESQEALLARPNDG